MFFEGASHLERWKAKGRILKPQTIVQHRRHLMNYLIPKFGKLTLDKIRPAAGYAEVTDCETKLVKGGLQEETF